MPLQQTVTILNNSGKIIGTVRPRSSFTTPFAPLQIANQTVSQGKTLLSVFKEAQEAYKDKRSQLKSDRALTRAATFDQNVNQSTRSLHRHHHHHDYAEEEDDDHHYRYHEERSHRGHDARSEASSRRTSRRSKSVVSKRTHRREDEESQYGGSTTSRGSALTEKNLKAMTQVSATAPSRPPPSTYQRPYAETMALSKMDVTNAQMRDLAVSERRPPPTALTRRASYSEVGSHSPYDQDRQLIRAPAKEIDMNLAYGELPPDLQERYDLDPVYGDEYQAKALTKRVEGLLVEANCLKYSAGKTIAHLQTNPDAAAAVACTLAELSKVVTKASPAVLAMLKGGSPAVWGLLASPQFMIGTGAVVGLTVIMFGGWKIVKRVKEQAAAREAMAYEGVPMDRPAPMRTQSEYSFGVDEALIVDDELSSIETWMRGVPAYGDDESADLELITPTADRATKSMKGDDFDVRSRRSTRTTGTTKTAKTSKTSKSSRSRREDDSDRRSTRHHTAESVAGSERSRKTSSTRRDRSTPRLIEDGRSQRGDDDLDFRPKIHRQGSNMLKALFKDNKSRSEVRV
ncbi:unnamed protein product [Clonostachys chloroleuca]|uniref:Uncharacterized protein n=1 Tax=Clonostachys chloroleuca TaxID=1926264 RepID=A0AA35M4B4_9HYPO|nr:unnamed protein product [Clonostachys chloroleuca]